MLDRGEALLRSRGTLLAAASLGMLGVACAAGWKGGAEPGEGVLTILAPALVLLGTFCLAGSVSSELRSGAVLLWIQRPRWGPGIYLGRLVEGWIWGCLVGWCVTGATAAGLWATGGADAGAYLLLRAVPAVPLLVLVGGLATWVVSAGGVEGDGAVAILLIVTLSIAGPVLGELGVVPPWISRIASLLAPPWEALGGMAGVLSGGGLPSPLQVLRLGAWSGGAVLLGTALLAARLRDPESTEPVR